MKIYCISALFLTPIVTFSQRVYESETDLIVKTIKHENTVKDSVRFDKSDGSLINRSFIFYKRFISSQDIDACVFIPSCSEYAIDVTKKHGKLVGGIMTFDRLLRCNGSANKQYEFDKKAKKFIDFP